MTRLLPLACLTLLTSATAAPLLGSTQSVTTSAFCAEYRCTLVSSGAFNPTRDARFKGYKQYTYQLGAPARMEVIRDGAGRITNVNITFIGIADFQWVTANDRYLTMDFAKAFTGAKATGTLKSACLTPMINRGDNFGSGTLVATATATATCAVTMEAVPGKHWPDATVVLLATLK